MKIVHTFPISIDIEVLREIVAKLEIQLDQANMAKHESLSLDLKVHRHLELSKTNQLLTMHFQFLTYLPYYGPPLVS